MAQAVELARTWDARVTLIRAIASEFGTNLLPEVYSEVAQRVFVPLLDPDFAFVPIATEFEPAEFSAAYEAADRLTRRFEDVTPVELSVAIRSDSRIIRVLRLIVGFGQQELAAMSLAGGRHALSASRIKALENGATASVEEADECGGLFDQLMTTRPFGDPPAGWRSKISKPDSEDGWSTVRRLASAGVPYDVFLHQRHYGGAFRQLLDSTSSRRGDILEAAVEAVFQERAIPYVRVQSGMQPLVRERFGIQVSPAPDFVVHDATNHPRAFVECKLANDGGTARDKAARFRALRVEATRLGGVPVFAVLSGLGWRRTGDALGPVVQATDGRVFTLRTVTELPSVFPLSSLAGTAT